MSDPYEELLAGDRVIRFSPGARHELVLSRLQAAVKASLADSAVARLLEPRSEICFKHGTVLRPDLSIVTAASNKPWLVAEVISSDDHRVDTVTKKQIYEEFKVPRLWMVDPRYDNVEVYHATEYGLKLMCILAGREVLEEKLLPPLQMVVSDLFGPHPAT